MMNHLKFKTIVISLFLVSAQLLPAQKTYNIHWRKEAAFTGFGLSTGITGVILGQKLKPLTIPQIAGLNRQNIAPIDRKATFWLSGKADRASDFFFYGATAVPLLLLADRKVNKESAEFSVLYFEALTIAGGLTHLTKNWSTRSRPYAYNPDFPLELKQRKDARRSFFSGHTSSTAASCFFAAKVWSDFHPGNRWKPAVWGLAAGIPAVTGYLRMRAGRHFLSDVLVGYAVGAATGYLVPMLHKRSRF